MGLCSSSVVSGKDRVYLESKSREEKARMAFKHLDKSHDGKISFKEFLATDVELTDESIEQAREEFDGIDEDGNKRLSEDEYVKYLLQSTKVHSDKAFDTLIASIMRSGHVSEKKLDKLGVESESEEESSSEDEETVRKRERAEVKAQRKKEKRENKAHMEALMSGQGTALARSEKQKRKKEKKQKKSKKKKKKKNKN